MKVLLVRRSLESLRLDGTTSLVGQQIPIRGCLCLLETLSRSFAALPRTKEESDMDELDWDGTGMSTSLWAECTLNLAQCIKREYLTSFSLQFQDLSMVNRQLEKPKIGILGHGVYLKEAILQPSVHACNFAEGRHAGPADRSLQPNITDRNHNR